MFIRIKNKPNTRLSHIHSLMRTRYGRHYTHILIHGKKNTTIGCKKNVQSLFGGAPAATPASVCLRRRSSFFRRSHDLQL